jgi:monofunctional biosynthetic peptidoglycan transglycosylase
LGEGPAPAPAASPGEAGGAPPTAADPIAPDQTGAIDEQGATAAADAPVSPGADSVVNFATEFAAVPAADVEAEGCYHAAAPAAVRKDRPAGPPPEPEAAAEPELRAAAPPHPAEPEPQTGQAVAIGETQPQAAETVVAAEAGPEPAEAVAVAEAGPEPVEVVADTAVTAVAAETGPAEAVAAPEAEPQALAAAQIAAEPEPPQIEAGAARVPGGDIRPEPEPAGPRWGLRSGAAAVPAVRTQGPSARTVPARLPPSLPPREAVGRYLRLAGHVAAAVVTGLIGIVLALVVLYRWVDPPVSTLMLGQRLAGTPIERRWVPLERISPHLVKAVILSEDGAFCRHRGVDWRALGQAMETARGGSTITMQVVKNLFLWPSRSYVRKAIEIALACLVELIWPKRRILEIYLNIAEWGDGVFGAEAAARWHFGKSAAQLTAAEAALLAVALPNPTERPAGSPSPQMSRLARRLMVRMVASQVSLSCVRTAPRLPRHVHLFPGRD